MLTGLLLDGTSVGDIANVLGLDFDATRVRIERLLGRVIPRDPAPGSWEAADAASR